MARRRAPVLLAGLTPLLVAGGLACGGGSALDLLPTPSPAATDDTQPVNQVPIGTATVAATNTPEGGQQEYTVQPGDTLGGIAAQFGVTVDAIAQLNQIEDVHLIVPGETLMIPAPE